MKYVSILLLLCIANSVFSQNQKKPVANPPYIKVSAIGMFQQESDGSMFAAGYLGINQSIAKHLLFGIDLGIYKPEGFRKVIIPVGLQLGIGNFRQKKISPVFFVGDYYPVYNETNTISIRSGNTTTTINTSSKGVFQLKLDGGLMLPFTAKNKIIIGGGYQQLILKHSVNIGSLSSTNTKKTSNTKFYLATITVIF